DVTTKFNRPDRNADPPLPTCQFQVFRSVCKSIGLRSVIRFDAQELKKVKWYVLHNSPEIDTYRSQFKRHRATLAKIYTDNKLALKAEHWIPNLDDGTYDEMLRLQGLGPNTPMGMPYTDDGIMAIVHRRKQRGHLPGVGRVLAGQGRDTADVNELKRTNKQLKKQMDMIMKVVRSDDRMSQLLTQLQSQNESGNGNGSSRGGDNEDANEDEDEDAGGDEDSLMLYMEARFLRRSRVVSNFYQRSIHLAPVTSSLVPQPLCFDVVKAWQGNTLCKLPNLNGLAFKDQTMPIINVVEPQAHRGMTKEYHMNNWKSSPEFGNTLENPKSQGIQNTLDASDKIYGAINGNGHGVFEDNINYWSNILEN
nr:homeodomain-like protein [Tanacetum cinerariifolium]